LSIFNELKRRNVLRVGAAYVVAAWLVIQVIETIFPAFGFGDAAIRIATIVFAIGLIPTLVFAWTFELTSEGLKKETELDRSSSITPNTGKKLDRMIMVVLALALGYFAFDKFVLNPQREAEQAQQTAEQLATVAVDSRQQGRTEALVESFGDQSIAVLAFDDMSQDGDQEYLSDGIAEELLNLLAKIPELRVISRSSAFSFKGQNLELTEIAERLNVAHILEGSVRKAGNQIRITAQLIEARSDTHLWSETYDRTLDDVFAIQDDIAATVVEQLKIELLGEAPHVADTDPVAYALFLQARHLGRQLTREGWDQSIALFKQALAIDPDYADAWDGLSANYINMAGRSELSYEEGYALAREATEAALAIDPDHARAHSSLGWIAMYHDTDLAASARHFERALQLAPSDTVNISGAALMLDSLGRVDEATAINQFLTTRDPLVPIFHASLADNYYYVNRWDDAIASSETALRLSPDYIGAHYQIGTVLLFKGDVEAALASFNREEGDEEWRVKGQTLALHALGRQQEHQARLDELIERWGNEWPSEVAHVYAYLDDKERAFEWLQKSVDKAEGYFNPHDPFLRTLTGDPRWLPLLESIGKSPAQLDAIEFEVTLPK
jgi:TolB-like protein